MKIGIAAFILCLLVVLAPVTVGENSVVIEVHEPEISGTTIQEAKFNVTVDIIGENINKVTLNIQYCSEGLCYMPTNVEMVKTGPGRYQGSYSEFEAGNDHYQFQISANYGDELTEQNEYQHILGLPGYEGDGTGDDDTADDDGSNNGNSEKNESPGFTPGSILFLCGIIALLFYIKRR